MDKTFYTFWFFNTHHLPTSHFVDNAGTMQDLHLLQVFLQKISPIFLLSQNELIKIH